jgi:hypothetical protein
VRKKESRRGERVKEVASRAEGGRKEGRNEGERKKSERKKGESSEGEIKWERGMRATYWKTGAKIGMA